MALGGARGWICMSCQLRLSKSSQKSAQRRAFSQTSSQSQTIRPPNAPQQTPNINHIIRNQKAYEDNCLKRRYLDRAEEARIFHIQYEKVADLRREIEEPKKQLRTLEKSIGALQAQKGHSAEEEIGRLKQEAQSLKRNDRIGVKERLLAEAEEHLHSLALSQPSLTSPQTPVNNSQDAHGNPTSSPKLLSYLNYDPNSLISKSLKTTPYKSHTDIGTALSLLDFTSASATTGWGWYYLLSQAALIEQALIQYALSILVRRGWTIVSPPSITYSYIAESCGFQPRDQNDEQQIYELSQSPRDTAAKKPPRSLAATAEIPLASMLADTTLPSSDVPKKVAGVSRCYRAEAGARGISSKGLYRVHEFNKVEMFAWTDCPSSQSSSPIDPLTSPEQWTQHSTPVFDEMVEIQTEILTSLNLPCRVLEMPVSDLGASAWRKIDIEAFFPSRYRPGDEADDDNGWGELTSASMCTDYQSRRLGTRVKDAKGGLSRFAHTVNGTAVAVPRVLAALLEYGYKEDGNGNGHVEIPEVLKRYMPGS